MDIKFKMNRFILTRLVITILFLFPAIGSLPAYSQVSVITERLRSKFINQDISIDEVSIYINTIKDDGSWNDIDYGSTNLVNWPSILHSQRLKQICLAYNKSGSKYYHDATVQRKIKEALDFYIDKDPVSDNWWLNDIGAPINFGEILLLMKSDEPYGINQDTLLGYSDSLLLYYSESVKKWPYFNSGANKIWFLKSSIYKACINENEDILRSNFETVFGEANIMPSNWEGIKADYSFHQHRAQLYIGGYGRKFMSDVLSFGMLAQGTDYAIKAEELRVLTNFVLDGFQWFCQEAAFDFGATGREIARPNAVSSRPVLSFIELLMEMGAPRLEELSACYNFIQGKAPFQYPGNKYFWNSEIMVHHGPDYYLSAKIPSSRTTATEAVNGENIKRKYLPWGATNIMIDGYEYYNIFPLWDWSFIPGVTSYKEEITLKKDSKARLVSASSYAGGVTDGVYGLAAYDYTFDSISGKKAWFFTPEAMYCLGAGINAVKNKAVITCINQCFSEGEIIAKRGLSKSNIKSGQKISKRRSWVHHNSIGYYFPKGGDITVNSEIRSGSWQAININMPADTIKDKITSIWINHGYYPNNDKYEYIVVPSTDANNFTKWIRNNPVETVLNSEDNQAFYDSSADLYAIAFYNSGSLSLQRKLVISSDSPCLIMLQNINNKHGYRLSVSDPTGLAGEINLSISKLLSGPGCTVNPDKTSTLKIMLKKGDETGKTISREYKILE